MCTSFLILSNPRCGSTYLATLLRAHPEVAVASELLNESNKINGDPLEYLQQEFATFKKKLRAFKLFPEQLRERNIRFDQLISALDIKTVIVLWRESVLNQLVSRMIADRTNVWYSVDPPQKIETIELEPDDVKSFLQQMKHDWTVIGHHWPLWVTPIFVKYEDLVENPRRELQKLYSSISCKYNGIVPEAYSSIQNPAPLHVKVSNWDKLPSDVKSVEFNLEIFLREILTKKLHSKVGLQTDRLHLIPEPEPLMPPSGWLYKVAEPFISDTMKNNVIEAVYSGDISSASHWTKLMADKFKKFFACHTAVPCSSGFTALLLSLQILEIGEGDEVILQSMTMVAVANAINFVGAKPVFVDNAAGKYNPGFEEISSAITVKTKAIIVTHTYGVACEDLLKIVEECNSRRLWLIEDISECIGVEILIGNERKLLGTFGDFAAASLYANKMIHAGDGGIVLSKHHSRNAELQSLINHGFTPYYHFLHFKSAINAKINGLGAALACGCIDNIKMIIQHRQFLAKHYRKLFEKLPIKLMARCGIDDTPWVFGVECRSKEERSELRAFLAIHGIETRNFFFPLHLQPAFSESNALSLPNSEDLGSRGFYLPTHTNMVLEDIQHIAAMVSSFYSNCEALIKTPRKKIKQELVITPGTCIPRVLNIEDCKLSTHFNYRESELFQTLALALSFDKCLVFDRWGSRQRNLNLVEEYSQKNCCALKLTMEHLQPYVAYFESEKEFESSSVRPWLNEDVDSDVNLAREIPTTTERETIQLIVWLIKKYKPQTIVELGCWLGHCTLVMAIAAKNYANEQPKIYACDAFRWQEWMPKEEGNKNGFKNGKKFSHLFVENMANFANFVVPVEWPYCCKKLPDELTMVKTEFIFIDISQDAAELEQFWKIIEPILIPGVSIVVFNGLSLKSISFITNHSDKLISLAKPFTIAKAFLYAASKNETKPIIRRKVKFGEMPNWGHHHKNAFLNAMNRIREMIHCDEAEVYFFVSLGEAICNHKAILSKNRWIAIVHEVKENSEHFYCPDLKRICGPVYRSLMKNCKGLFVLTTVQKEYLEENLSLEFRIPIQRIFYPIVELVCVESAVLSNWRNQSEVNIVFVGSFARDYQLFYKAKFPQNCRKAIIISDLAVEAQRSKISSEVAVHERLNDEEYEEMLKKSIVFLALKYDGAANTVILECIARNVPIVVPAMRSTVEYIGEKYPLLYDTSTTDFTHLISEENIGKAIEYLQKMDKEKFSLEKFVENVTKSAVFLAVPPRSDSERSLVSSFFKFDVTICICSFKRTHNLREILEKLWYRQDYN
ncbi:uncharacterized protein B4U79_01519, partial [Dinothrombium tinctorium]